MINYCNHGIGNAKNTALCHECGGIFSTYDEYNHFETEVDEWDSCCASDPNWIEWEVDPDCPGTYIAKAAYYHKRVLEEKKKIKNVQQYLDKHNVRKKDWELAYKLVKAREDKITAEVNAEIEAADEAEAETKAKLAVVEAADEAYADAYVSDIKADIEAAAAAFDIAKKAYEDAVAAERKLAIESPLKKRKRR